MMLQCSFSIYNTSFDVRKNNRLNQHGHNSRPYNYIYRLLLYKISKGYWKIILGKSNDFDMLRIGDLVI